MRRREKNIKKRKRGKEKKGKERHCGPKPRRGPASSTPLCAARLERTLAAQRMESKRSVARRSPRAGRAPRLVHKLAPSAVRAVEDDRGGPSAEFPFML